MSVSFTTFINARDHTTKQPTTKEMMYGRSNVHASAAEKRSYTIIAMEIKFLK